MNRGNRDSRKKLCDLDFEKLFLWRFVADMKRECSLRMRIYLQI